jgi:hypothetical protein
MNFSAKTPDMGKRIAISVQEFSIEIKIRTVHELMCFGTAIQLYLQRGLTSPM